MTRAAYGRGTGRNRRDGSMGKLEKRFLDEVILPMARLAWWRYEPWALRLAKGSSYTCDFAVMLDDGELLMVEVKGRWEANARTKCKVAAESFPLKLFGVMWDRKAKAWTWEAFHEATS